MIGYKRASWNLIIWLAPRAGKMNQIMRCDWLPEQARWSHLARSGLPAASRKKIFPESFIDQVCSVDRWLDIVLVLFLRVMDLDSVLVHTFAQKNLTKIHPSGPHTYGSTTHTSVTLVRCIAGSVGLMFAILRILRKARAKGGYSMFREMYLRATTYE